MILALVTCHVCKTFDLCASVSQNAMALLRSELHDLRTRFDDSLSSHENTSKSLTEQIRELNQQREQAQQEVRTFKILVIMLVSSVAPM